MPCTYVIASPKLLPRVMFSPCPTIIPDKIGIIGNTHGVNDSPSPARKNNPNAYQRLPLSAAANPSCSDTIGAPVPEDSDLPAALDVFATGNVNDAVFVIGL